MTTFTSTLPEDLLKELTDAAKNLNLPKNKLIEKALRLYLEQINKAAYIKSYREMGEDADVLKMAEEGMAEYAKQLTNL
jgi:metal-responsive CopG/Arc/MetJ family transcriptional regulator